ncbi:hypothetical protein MATL_G00101620 [Megalops atlanticus]|uniref:Uncharacterized protein n=1 Tax=Megalops atlanticus TaxID=7932 RepID=A0A9D3TF16_MEGAT|nr:hypothetical protein MATL_G00101620 [Megalops atlanticus]
MANQQGRVFSSSLPEATHGWEKMFSKCLKNMQDDQISETLFVQLLLAEFKFRLHPFPFRGAGIFPRWIRMPKALLCQRT